MERDGLRLAIVQALEFINDDERHRLHFIFGDQVPRPVRENRTVNGTFTLIETLFEREKLNQNDLTTLINVFRRLKCVRAAEVLRDFDRVNQTDPSKSCDENLETNLIDELLDDQDDRSPSIGPRQDWEESFDNIRFGDRSEKERNATKNFISNRSMIIIFLGLIGLIAVLTISLIMSLIQVKFYRNEIERLKETSSRSNQTEQKQILFSKLNSSSQVENRQYRDHCPILVGKKFGFGSTNFQSFDDSEIPDFRSSFYLVGTTVRGNDELSETYQFHYRSSLKPSEQPLESSLRGNRFRIAQTWNRESLQKLTKVDGYIQNRQIRLSNETIINQQIITGLRFYVGEQPMHSRIDLVENSTIKYFSESMPGYFIGFVRGQFTEHIHQIQCVWYQARDEDSYGIL